jgi:hypothetical protein
MLIAQVLTPLFSAPKSFSGQEANQHWWYGLNITSFGLAFKWLWL